MKELKNNEITDVKEAISATENYMIIDSVLNTLIHELFFDYEKDIRYRWISYIDYKNLIFDLNLSLNNNGIITFTLPIKYLYKDIEWCKNDWRMRHEILDELEGKRND